MSALPTEPPAFLLQLHSLYRDRAHKRLLYRQPFRTSFSPPRWPFQICANAPPRNAVTAWLYLQ